ncbi:hypothetical protein EFB08_10260 [Rufibacter latericius]|uniref:Uncharacterized protein n=1 Tax=Rufibacter latericius TaxID=2487040 RepID=A0A3M9MPQ4_9BACT|nr:hypothetical protein EFB08_10260 [Rufibacter latericius]
MSVSEFLFFLILLVTFLIKEKSDKPQQTAASALRLGKKELESKGRRKVTEVNPYHNKLEADASRKLQTSDHGRSKSQT